jgi:tRNA uridine 5-carboxymethylaminomethyl modification enzyme
MSTIKQAQQRKYFYMAKPYDVAVIGAGHAGCEAALATARLGFRTVLFTMNLDAVANMPCNPNIGGTAKGQLVREVDALGGQMGKVADETFIQSRMLNSSKGPAVLSPRAQIDRREYQIQMKQVLENCPNLDLKQTEIIEILYKSSSDKEAEASVNTRGSDKSLPDGILKIEGVVSKTNAIYPCKTIILSTGTYMDARIIIGETSFSGGPDGSFPSRGLSDSLKAMGIHLQRFKTGTPVRVHKNTISFGKMEEQYGDPIPCLFSYENEDCPDLFMKQQMSCFLTWTTAQTKETVMQHLARSPLYSGDIDGTGPRYCPSFEDKVVKFPAKERHQIFVEPTGVRTNEMYIQGLSSSMPEEIQIRMLQSIPGLEQAMIMRPAYAIEYECVVPTDLHLSLEHKRVTGLFCAGQINGSSGYEEAAAQGIIAGINAAMKLRQEEPIILDRSIAYIGVLIDDLVTKGTTEPYRMMTSRAEYRLILRQDNADERLTPIGYRVGLISRERYDSFLQKRNEIADEVERLRKTVVRPQQEVGRLLESLSSTPLKTGSTLAELLRRPEITYRSLAPIDPDRPDCRRSVIYEAEVIIKYEGYIALELERIHRFRKMETRKIPEGIHYEEIKGLRLEARQKLMKIRPDYIGQAGRISGVSPADISVLLVYIDSLKREQANARERGCNGKS